MALYNDHTDLLFSYIYCTVVIVKTINEDSYLIDISPNSSLNGLARLVFLLSISLVCIGIATVFFFLGAVLILPFAGLEIIILLTAFYLNFNWSRQRQKIFISQDLVLIQKGRKKIEYSWQEFRTFTSFLVDKNSDEITKLCFRSKGIDVEVAEFLNQDDKKILQKEISEIIDKLNN